MWIPAILKLSYSFYCITLQSLRIASREYCTLSEIYIQNHSIFEIIQINIVFPREIIWWIIELQHSNRVFVLHSTMYVHFNLTLIAYSNTPCDCHLNTRMEEVSNGLGLEKWLNNWIVIRYSNRLDHLFKIILF